MLKKLLSILMALMLTLSAVACAQPAAPAATAEPAAPAATEAPKADPAPAATAEPAAEEEPFNSLDDFKLFAEDGSPLYTDRADSGEQGVVSSGKYEASKIGVQILEAGGNAIDAAIAVGFALSVCEPNASGLCGSGFITLRDGETGECVFIDMHDKSPLHADLSYWGVDDEGKIIDGDNWFGGASCGTPTQLRGMAYALEKYGTMSLAEVIAPSIELAREGFTVTPNLNSMMTNAYDHFLLYSECADVFLKEVDGIYYPYEVGERFRNPDYAHTLELIAENGIEIFYEGEIADAMIANVNKYGGRWVKEDLTENSYVEEKPLVTGTYRGYDIISAPLPSSGGVIICEILNILENWDLSKMEDNSVEELHLIAEAFKLAYADRNNYLGDPAFVDNPIVGLSSKEYAAAQAALISAEATIPADKVLQVDPWAYETGNTTSFSVADKDGNIVCITTSLNAHFGSRVCIPGYGFIVSDSLGDYNIIEGHPNCLAPGKESLSSMSPTIVMKDGKPFAVIGSPGGTTIIAAIVHVISNLIDHGMSVEEAVNAPRLWGFSANTVNVEGQMPADVVAGLEALGHTVKVTAEWNPSAGSANSVVYLEDGTLEGAGDPRRDGKALGF